MKHVRKVCAVLLAALMVAVILPATGLLAPAIDAADVGMIENGGFETGSGTGWTVYQWGVSFENKSASRNSGTYGCRLSKDQSHNGATINAARRTAQTFLTCFITVCPPFDQ